MEFEKIYEKISIEEFSQFDMICIENYSKNIFTDIYYQQLTFSYSIQHIYSETFHFI